MARRLLPAATLAVALALPLQALPASAATVTVATSAHVAAAAPVTRVLLAGFSAAEGRGWTVPLKSASGAAKKKDAARAGASGAHAGHAHADVLGESTGRLAASASASSTARFSLAAVSWSSSTKEAVTGVEVRVREDGRWGEWYALGVVDATESAGRSGSRVGSEPVLAQGGTGVQARVRTTSGRVPAGVRIDLVDPGSGRQTLAGVADNGTPPDNNTGTPPNDNVNGNEPNNGNVEPPAPPVDVPEFSADADGGLRPDIVTRAQWGANESWSWDSSRSTQLKAMYVHHTVSTNSYTQAQVPAMMRSIYRYHTRSLGWPDIGYHFLVDKFGTIYEGRRGSLDSLVVGAQAGGYNADTIGVSVIGSYHKSYAPRQATVDSIVQILAWQAYRYGLDPTSKVKLKTATSSKSGTKWKAGKWTPALPVIRGHRDTNITACPGGKLQEKLPAIRRAVKTLVDGTTATIGASPRMLAAPKPTPLTAKQTPVSLPHKTTVRWKAVPGAVAYEVLTRTASHTGTVPGGVNDVWNLAARATKASHSLPITAAHTSVIGVRAVDAYARAGAVSVIGTITRPMGRSAMVRSKTAKTRWSLVSNKKGYYRTEAFSTRKKGATLTVRKVTRAKEVWIIAPGAKSFGRVYVYAGSKRVKTVQMRTAKRVKQRIIKVDLPGTRFSGTVTIRTADKKLLRISALAFPRG